MLYLKNLGGIYLDWTKYPKTKTLMDSTGMTLDQVLIFTENALKKLQGRD